MFTIVGAVVTTICVIMGYVLHEGNLAILVQPTEVLIIGGAALGSLIMANSPYVLKGIVAKCIASLKGTGINKAAYIELEDLMNSDLDIVTEEEHVLVGSINRVSDAMPGLGIVAAVLGVVITMGKLTQGKEVIGHSVAAALVGTFLGILFSYGYLQPLGAKVESNLKEEMRFMITAKICLLAFAKGVNAKVCAEFGRRSIPTEYRPSFKEVDEATANAGKK